MRKDLLIICFLCVVGFLSCGHVLCAQTSDGLYTTDYHVDSLCKGQLSVELDNVSFFKDNEFNSTYQKGYTLPGFWLQIKAVYYPLSNLKVEAGVHSIWFWGTTLYPAFAYKGISTWEGQDYSHNVHVLPYFRANLALSDNVSVILGDIYGAANHRLIEPLYNPELNLTSDPEVGAQLLYTSKWVDFDSWVNWESFIYKLDTHQESFLYGFSTRFKANNPKSLLHVYLQLQGLAQHNGGELDTLKASVQTTMNGAVGAGVLWNVNRRVMKSFNAEFDLAGYNSPIGESWPLKRGFGYYSKIAAQLQDFNIKAAYWSCDDFISLYGSAFYGAMSTKEEGMLYKDPSMLYLGVEYEKPLSKGFVLGIMADFYCHLSGSMYSIETGLNQSSAFGCNNNFSIGISMRINPSFLLKKY